MTEELFCLPVMHIFFFASVTFPENNGIFTSFHTHWGLGSPREVVGGGIITMA